MVNLTPETAEDHSISEGNWGKVKPSREPGADRVCLTSG